MDAYRIEAAALRLAWRGLNQYERKSVIDDPEERHGLLIGAFFPCALAKLVKRLEARGFSTRFDKGVG